MKTLKNYIIEQEESNNIDIYRLNNVIATYNVKPEKIILQAPESYSESDIQIYMSDRFFKNMPSYTDYADKFFGLNKDNIYDVRFEYDSFEHLEEEPKESYIEWDVKYDKSINVETTKLSYFIIKRIKYIIEFDRFDLVNTTDNTVKPQLIQIFKTAESNSNNKWSLDIKFDEYGLKYRK